MHSFELGKMKRHNRRKAKLESSTSWLELILIGTFLKPFIVNVCLSWSGAGVFDVCLHLHTLWYWLPYVCSHIHAQSNCLLFVQLFFRTTQTDRRIELPTKILRVTWYLWEYIGYLALKTRVGRSVVLDYWISTTTCWKSINACHQILNISKWR